MARTPLKKVCLNCPQEYSDTALPKCRTCGWVLKRVRVFDKVPTAESGRKELREAVLCCPKISCPVWKVDTKAELPKQEKQTTLEAPSCYKCKEILEVATIHLWLDKIGNLTPTDLAGFLQNSDKLVKRAATANRIGLKFNAALTVLHQAIREMSGVGFDILEDWAHQNIAPHVERGTVTNRARYAALEAARELGIDEPLAAVVFDQLAPPCEITSHLEPSEQSSDNHSARHDQSPPEAMTPTVIETTTAAAAEVSKAATPSLEVDSKPGANAAHTPASQAAATPQAAAILQAAAIPQAAAVLNENPVDANKNRYQGFEWLGQYANKVTAWENFKKTIVPLRNQMQRHPVISTVLTMCAIILAIFGSYSDFIQISEHERAVRERKQNRRPILSSIKCDMDHIEAAKPIVLDAMYEDDQSAEKLNFNWEVQEETMTGWVLAGMSVTGVENKSSIKLNAMSLKARGGFVRLRITLKIRDQYDLESNEREKIVTVIANRPPSFKSTFKSAMSVSPGTDVLLTAQAVDPDGDKITYEWVSDPSTKIYKIVDDGSQAMLETTGLNPSKSRDIAVTIFITANDGIIEAVEQQTIFVKSPESVKSTEAPLPLITLPPPTHYRLECQAEKDTVERIGETIKLHAVATDSVANKLYYKWETDAGKVDPQYGENVTLHTEGINPSTKIIKVTMTVINGNGGSVSYYIPIKVKLSTSPALPVPEPTAHPLPTQETKPNSNSRAVMIP